MEMYNQDDDKRLTVDLATSHYGSLVKSIFYVDRDEFLFCGQAGGGLEAQRRYQQMFVDTYMPRSADEVLIPRINVASYIPPAPQNPSDEDIVSVLEVCLRNAHAVKSMRLFWGCYSAAWLPKTKAKGLYAPDACPFHELHKPCLR
jgi:hypothetical protein